MANAGGRKTIGVIGAGMVGVTTASFLLRSGHGPTEQHRDDRIDARALALSQGRDAQHIVGDHAGIVVPNRSGWGATDQDVGVGPHRQAGAAAAVCLVAHDVAPLVAMDIATLVTGTDEMPDFMHE